MTQPRHVSQNLAARGAWLAALPLVLWTVSPGCTLSFDPNQELEHCEGDEDCGSGVCHRGFCVPDADPSGRDASVPSGGDGDAMNGGGAMDAGDTQPGPDGQVPDGEDGGTHPVSDAGDEETCGGDASDEVRECPDEEAEGLVASQGCVLAQFCEDGTWAACEEYCGDCGEGGECPDGGTCCQGRCVDTSSDDNHCGGCYGEDGARCEGTDRCCDSACVDTEYNDDHCGGCGACDTGRSCCEGSCINPQSNDDHCGGCFGRDTDAERCDASDSCCDGSCDEVCGCDICEAQGLACCDERCVDPASDAEHCGGCTDTTATSATGVTCADGQICSDGECCPEGHTWCEEADACFNLSNDESNCGTCGNECSVNETCCSGTCVNTHSDSSHCGGCGVSCSGTCSDGNCCRLGILFC